MSVKDRLDDARILYANGRKDGALLSVLVAIGATSRKRYPRNTKLKDYEAFTTFLAEELVVATHGGAENYNVRVPGAPAKYSDEMMPLQNVFYELIRCNLVHEAIIPSNVRFEQSNPGGQFTKITDNELVLSDSWIDGLGKVIEHAPENSDQFPHVAEVPEEVLAWVLFGKRRDRRIEYMKKRADRVRELVLIKTKS